MPPRSRRRRVLPSRSLESLTDRDVASIGMAALLSRSCDACSAPGEYGTVACSLCGKAGAPPPVELFEGRWPAVCPGAITRYEAACAALNRHSRACDVCSLPRPPVHVAYDPGTGQHFPDPNDPTDS